MFDRQQDRQPYVTVGTTSPIYIPRGPEAKAVRPGESYFVVRIKGAQAAFSGPLWEKARRLIVTSQVSLNHPLLGPEPLQAIQRSREVHKGRAEQLGLSPNLINLVPATMDHVSISLEFIVDKENRLAALGGLINDDAFITAISLAPGAAAAARTIGTLADKILQTFLEPEERQPILAFSGDFNIATGDLQDGYYVILGTRDERNPLPRPLPTLEVQDGDLLADGQPVTQWSYVILDVRCLEVRTRDLNEGAGWAEKLRRAEGVAQRLGGDPFVGEEERRQAWQECKNLLKEAQVLLMEDPTYLRREAQDIIKEAYVRCREQIFGAEAGGISFGLPGTPKGPMRGEADTPSDRAFLGIPPEEDLHAAVRRYTAQVSEARRLLQEAGLL
ncbi:MAG: hypothetical protein D6759_13020 [Chloroflexi bacterium]|nr:MAG: hypothetical protein D6759_13020 [Chloroflexota bacterium]